VKVLRTPDDRFAAPGAAWLAPRYVDVPSGEGSTLLRMACVDEGPREAPLVLMLHGEPTWSYLYRTIAARVREAGLRVVAPDLVGFGRSDKPASPSDYTYERHLGWTLALIRAMALRGVHLVCHDWGGLIGLRLVAAHPELFSSVVAMNTALPIGHSVPQEFLDWRHYAQNTPALPIAKLIQSLCTTTLTPEARAAYEAPFPEESYKAGARAFPALVPIDPDDPEAAANRSAWEALGRFDRPFLTIFGGRDPMTRGSERAFQTKIPGARNQPHALLPDAGHFIQEDAGEDLGRRIAAFVQQQAGPSRG
jgi:haloalkane dehalogenase